MSKSVSILEGGTSKQFGTTAKLRTNLSGGGTCDWVPEDEVRLGTKSINEDGTYYAEDDGYYGYSQVTVNGAGGITYTAQEGDQIGGVPLEPNEPYSLEEDGNGGIDENLLPSAIGFTLLPSKQSYEEGETIVLTGANVRAYKNSGGDWESEDYPGGIVPLSELTLDPATAHVDPSQKSDKYTYLGQTLYPVEYMTGITVTSQSAPIYGFTYEVNGDICYALVSSGRFSAWFPLGDGMGSHEGSSGNENYQIRAKTLRGYSHYATPVYSQEEADAFFNSLGGISSPFNPTPVGTAVKVKWNRPYDGKTLETSFDIIVDRGEFEGGGGGHDF